MRKFNLLTAFNLFKELIQGHLKHIASHTTWNAPVVHDTLYLTLLKIRTGSHEMHPHILTCLFHYKYPKLWQGHMKCTPEPI